MRHINSRVLWPQEKRFKEPVAFIKNGGKEDLADLCATHVYRALLGKHIGRTAVKDMDGTASVAARERQSRELSVSSNIGVPTLLVLDMMYRAATVSASTLMPQSQVSR